MVAFETMIYLAIGLIIMMIGYWIVDYIIPADFPKEIQEGNKAIGWVSAGIYMGIGFIIRSSIISFEITEAMDLVKGLIGTGLYSLIGIIAFIIGYFVVDIVNKKFNFNVELEKGNEAAGIMVFGIFMGVAFIVSGVIQ